LEFTTTVGKKLPAVVFSRVEMILGWVFTNTSRQTSQDRKRLRIMEQRTINGVIFRKSGKYSWEITDPRNPSVGISVFTQPVAPDYKETNYGVNWAGMGTKSIFDTMVFATRLNAAATLAAQLNFQLATGVIVAD
jgi:hypothetical protein